MRIKGISLLLSFFILTTFISCFEQLCDQYKYYDYHGIEIGHFDSYIPLGDSLYIRIDNKDIEFIGSSISMFSNKLYALSCDKGWGGVKYPLIRVSVKSNGQFNDSLPAGSELNSIIKVRGTNSQNKYKLGYLDDFDIAKINSGQWYLSIRPESIKTHKLTFEFEKSNGEVYSTTTGNIEWQ